MSGGSLRLRAADPVPQGGAKCIRQRLCCSCTIKIFQKFEVFFQCQIQNCNGPLCSLCGFVHSYSSEVSFSNLHCQAGSSSKNFEKQHVLKQRWPLCCYMACACETAVRHIVLWSAMPCLYPTSACSVCTVVAGSYCSLMTKSVLGFLPWRSLAILKGVTRLAAVSTNMCAFAALGRLSRGFQGATVL